MIAAVNLTPTFQKSLAKLEKEERNVVNQQVMDFMFDPAAAGHRLHGLNLREKRFCSLSPNMDLRIIVLREGARFALMYVDHHDDAYRWAERRKIETNAVTGSAQIVEFEEVVREEIVQVPRAAAAPPLFLDHSDAYLLSLGVPPVYLPFIRDVSDEDQLAELLGRLPEEAAEALIALAAGEVPEPPEPPEQDADPFDTPDAKRRFWVAADEAALALALEKPWDEWAVFLHPSQRRAVDHRYGGPARVTGSAGTGKSVVAVHRAARLARESDGGRILLTTYSKALGYRLSENVDQLLGSGSDARGRVTVSHLHAYVTEGLRHYGWQGSELDPPRARLYLSAAYDDLKKDIDPRFDETFLEAEWFAIVDFWGAESFAEYKDLPRTGRGKSLTPLQRKQVWPVFQAVLDRMKLRNQLTFGGMCGRLRDHLKEEGLRPFRHVVIDEAQDLAPRELALVAALAPKSPDSLFFVGDTGQRIAKWPFSWARAGVDIRGRSRRLKVNYRTSRQICRFADRLMPSTSIGPDGEAEDRRTVSLLTGPDPEIVSCTDADAESAALTNWITVQRDRGVTPSEIALLARSAQTLTRSVEPVLAALGLAQCSLVETEPDPEAVSVGTLEVAKGLEFRAIALIGVEDDHIPSARELREIQAEEARDAILERERQLFYVGCTRPRETLLMTHIGPISRFLSPT